jgi:hypothetical protein
MITVTHDQGDVVRRIDGKTSAGIHRVTWDFRYPGFTPTSLESDGYGPLAIPGTYAVTLDKRVDGTLTTIAGPADFEVAPLGESSLPAADREAVLAFAKKTGELQRAVFGANEIVKEATNKIQYIKQTIEKTPGLDPSLLVTVRQLELRLADLEEQFRGDPTMSDRSEPAMPGIMDRINQIIRGVWGTTSAPTATHRKNLEIASDAFSVAADDLRQLVESDLPALESELEAGGAPWTPGRGVPEWRR